MNDSKIGVRYAKAFFEVGSEKYKLESLRHDIEIIALACKQKEIQLLLESPVIKSSKKQQLFAEIFRDKIQKISLSFLLMIIENRRENYIPAICRYFVDLFQKSKGIKAAKVTTAFEINDELKKKIIAMISEVFKCEVELSTALDASLIGGFLLRVGDQQIDGSVSNRLSNIKREFLDKAL